MLAASIALPLSGCVTAQDMEAMRSDINRLQIQIAEYQDNLGKLRQELQGSVVENNQQLSAQNRDIQAGISDLAAADEVIKRNQADINAKMDSMITNLMALGGKSEEGTVSAMGIGAKIDSMNATLNLRLDGMDRSINQLGTKVSSLEKAVAVQTMEPQEGEVVDSGTAEGQAEGTPEPKQTQEEQEMPPVPAGDPTEIYQNAYADYSKGNYDLAIVGFEGFLNDFPDAMLAPNAQYWLGECYYSRKEFDKAAKEFDKVIKNYQGAIKVPSAYLKKGFSLEALGNNEAAKAQYRKIVDAYPLAPEAAIAKEKLKQKK